MRIMSAISPARLVADRRPSLDARTAIATLAEVAARLNHSERRPASRSSTRAAPGTSTERYAFEDPRAACDAVLAYLPVWYSKRNHRSQA